MNMFDSLRPRDFLQDQNLSDKGRYGDYFSVLELNRPHLEGIAGAQFASRVDGCNLVAAGHTETSAGKSHACKWVNGSPSLLEEPESVSGSVATYIHSDGTIIGNGPSTLANYKSISLVWDSKGVHELLPLKGDPQTCVYEVNSKGLIAGVSFRPNENDRRAVVWFDGKPTALPVPPTTVISGAFAVNDNHLIVGGASDKRFEDMRPVAWIKNRAIFLTEEGTAGVAMRVTESNLALGARSRDGTMHPCVWDLNPLLHGGTMRDVRCVDIASSASFENFSPYHSTIFERESGLSILIHTQLSANFNRLHGAMFFTAPSLEELGLARGHDLNTLVPGAASRGTFEHAFGNRDGTIAATGYWGSALLIQQRN